MFGFAIHNYKSAFGHWPGPSATDKLDGHRNWRVEILPFLDHKDIYDSIDRNAKWNSNHNLGVSSSHPDLFNCPGSQIGGATAYELLVKLDIHLATASHADAKIVLAEFPPDKRPWISPAEFSAIDLVNRLKTRQAGSGHNDKFHVLFDDGRVELVDAQALVDALSRGLATPQ